MTHLFIRSSQVQVVYSLVKELRPGNLFHPTTAMIHLHSNRPIISFDRLIDSRVYLYLVYVSNSIPYRSLACIPRTVVYIHPDLLTESVKYRKQMTFHMPHYIKGHFAGGALTPDDVDLRYTIVYYFHTLGRSGIVATSLEASFRGTTSYTDM